MDIRQHYLNTRLASHGLDTPRFDSPKELIRHFGCLQAQDTGQARWVIGSRLPHSTYKELKKSLTKGEIIRTWPMRGTLHYTDPAIVPWMLALCASLTLPGFAKRREYLNISEAHADAALEAIESALYGGKQLTRAELGNALRKKNLTIEGQLLYHFTCYAATKGIICFGPPTENDEDTFVLLCDWIPQTKLPSRDEQLRMLAHTYIQGHGPASVDDLAWWSGLPKTDCKKAFALVKPACESITLPNDKKEYLYKKLPAVKKQTSVVTLLGGFDEYFLGYKDRSVVADIAHHKKLFSSNGIFFPLVMHNGQIIGTWKRTIKKDTVTIHITLLPEAILSEKKVDAACKAYSKFWGYSNYIVDFTETHH